MTSKFSPIHSAWKAIMVYQKSKGKIKKEIHEPLPSQGWETNMTLGVSILTLMLQSKIPAAFYTENLTFK